jgi:hypothetical protein
MIAAGRGAGRTREVATTTNRIADLSLSAAGWSLRFIACPEVVSGLEAILTGWGLTRNSHSAPDATIIHSDGRYRWDSPARSKPALWDKRPPATSMNVISDVHDVLFDWYLADHPDLLCLHAGALDFGTGLVCFPSVRQAGKSTLCVALAARGVTFYCDDVLPVDPRSLDGIAMGIAPLLRKPVPNALIAFTGTRAGPSNEKWSYICLDSGRMAPFGERRAIQALVLLTRQEAVTATLASVARSEMLRELVMQNFGARSAPAAILGSFASLVETRPCFRMTYDDLEEAADLLAERFA